LLIQGSYINLAQEKMGLENMIVGSSISQPTNHQFLNPLVILHSSSSSSSYPTVALFSPVPNTELIQSTPAIEQREKCVNTTSGYCTPFVCSLSLTQPPSQATPPYKRQQNQWARPPFVFPH
uniref:Uncharacterized protein n=1 Tax=Aegilops tauschii subsp. strangulata TaxID=200361 RepID=A0A453IHH1_AEGTS